MPTLAKPRSVHNARNLLKADPSRTALIRRAFIADLRRRFGKIKSDIWRLIVTQDGMGLRRKGLTANAWSDEARERSAEVRRARMRHDDPQVPVLRAEAEKTFPEGTRRNEASFALAPSKWDVVLTQHVGERLVGVASLWRDPDTAEDGVPHGQYLKVRNIATYESGRGRDLMNDVIQYAAEKNAGIYLSSLGSSRWFYQKLGLHEGVGFTYYLTPAEVKELAGVPTTNASDDQQRKQDNNLALLALLLASPPSQKVKQFELWLDKLLHTYLMPVGAKQDPWFVKYLDDAYKKGVARSFDESGHTPSAHPLYPIIRATFTGAAAGRPDRVDTRKLRVGKADNTLKASTALIATSLASLLGDGLKKGKSPTQIAKDMGQVIDGVFEKRAKTMAKTEVVGAQAQGQLDGAKDLGFEDVGVEAEWVTAGDLAVCARCAELEGQVIPISMAEGMIPMHVGCRCSFKIVRKGKKSPKRVNVFIP